MRFAVDGGADTFPMADLYVFQWIFAIGAYGVGIFPSS